jgi:hypothetical protein
MGGISEENNSDPKEPRQLTSAERLPREKSNPCEPWPVAIKVPREVSLLPRGHAPTLPHSRPIEKQPRGNDAQLAIAIERRRLSLVGSCSRRSVHRHVRVPKIRSAAFAAGGGSRGSHPGVEASKCSWSKPLDIGGDKTKDSVATDMIEISGDRFHIRGIHELTVQSGDKVALRYQGVGVSKDNQARSKGTFAFAEGPGKLKGITGKGTISCKPAGDGASCDVVGEYQVAK